MTDDDASSPPVPVKARHARHSGLDEASAGKMAQKSAKIAQNTANEPHYLGHRERLRTRFADGPDQLPDYEMLELLLFRSIPRADVKGLAKTLIARFGSLPEVLSATPEHLAEVSGVGPAIVHDLKLIEAAARRLSFGAIRGREVLSSWNSVLDYCRTAMGFAEVEELRLLFLDKKNGLIRDEVMQRGTVDHTPVYPREIMRRALQLNATAIILVHNHPTVPILIMHDHAIAH